MDEPKRCFRYQILNLSDFVQLILLCFIVCIACCMFYCVVELFVECFCYLSRCSGCFEYYDDVLYLGSSLNA